MFKQEMEYRPLGKCGTRVSAFGLGGWTTFGDSVTDEETVRAVLTAAFEAGINFFDIADVYNCGESERAMGKVLSEFKRSELVITSKVFFPLSDDPNDRGLSRKHIMESIDKSLKRIGTDYLDIYFCHRFDEHTPIEETARAMDDLVHQGKVIYWGTSEWAGTQLAKLHDLCDQNNLYFPQVEQPRYSLLARKKFEQDVLPTVKKFGMGMVVWSPLEMGILTGKYDEGLPAGSRFARIDWLRESELKAQKVEQARKFKPLAEKVGGSRTQVALAWAASQPGVSSVILGVTSLEQLRENLAAMQLKIPTDVRTELDKLFPPTGRADDL